MGVELLKSSGEGSESILKALWHHSDAIMCCSMKVPIYIFASCTPSLEFNSSIYQRIGTFVAKRLKIVQTLLFIL